MSSSVDPAAIINPFYPQSKDAQLANRASDDALAAALHGVDVNKESETAAALNHHHNQSSSSSSASPSSRRSGAAAASSSSRRSRNEPRSPQQERDAANAEEEATLYKPLTEEEQKYPVAWQLTAVREELAETRNISSRLRRQIGERDRDCALLEARIVEAGNKRKELENEITEQLKRRSRVGQLTVNTENQKQKIVHGKRGSANATRSSSSSASKTSLGRPLSSNHNSSASSTSSSRDFDYTTTTRGDEKKLQLEEEIHAREMAELRYRHRMFREEIIKWQKKRRILENSSLKMSTQADDEKLFDFANARQKKEERKLLQAAERIRNVQASEKNHLEAQNREISKQLGNLRFKVRDAEEELAAKRRQMQKLRAEADRVQRDVIKAREDTAQSVIQAQEALEKVRFEEEKSMKEARRKQQAAAQRELVNAMSPLGTNIAQEEQEQKQKEPVQNEASTEKKSEAETTTSPKDSAAAAASSTNTSPLKPTFTGVSPPRKLPPASTTTTASQQQQQNPQNYQKFLQSVRSNENNNINNNNDNIAVPTNNNTTTAIPSSRPPQQQPHLVTSDKSHTYNMYDASGDDPRDAWYTLAPRDGASTDELFGELTRIVRTVAVEFGKPALRVLDGIPDGEDL